MRAGLIGGLPARKPYRPRRSMPMMGKGLCLAYVRPRTDRAGLFEQAALYGLTVESLAVAIIRRLGFELVLMGMAAATPAAEPENSVAAGGLDLLTVQTAQFDAHGLARAPHYRFTASIVPIHASDAVPFGLEFSNASRLTSAAERQKEIAWATNSNLTRFLGGDRASFSPRLRLESTGQRLEILPRRHSVWIQWRKTLP